MLVVFFLFFYFFGALDSDWIGECTAGHVTPESRGLILQKAFVVITNPPAPSLPVQSSLKRLSLSKSFPSSCFFLTQPHGHHTDFSSKAHPANGLLRRLNPPPVGAAVLTCARAQSQQPPFIHVLPPRRFLIFHRLPSDALPQSRSNCIGDRPLKGCHGDHKTLLPRSLSLL